MMITYLDPPNLNQSFQFEATLKLLLNHVLIYDWKSREKYSISIDTSQPILRTYSRIDDVLGDIRNSLLNSMLGLAKHPGHIR